ncbi:hypothetical protein GS979_24545 [Rhodococcus hoagii]|nr:hypothetical protein [Prescottella equi]NKW49507.1 hypothetical protein [Prescottella equi]
MTTDNRAAPGPTKDTGSDHRGWDDDKSRDDEPSAVAAAAAASAVAVTA